MKKSDLARRLARRRHISRAQAADQLDGVIHDILRNLRTGKSAALPGLGTLKPGRTLRFRPETAAGRDDKPRRNPAK